MALLLLSLFIVFDLALADRCKCLIVAAGQPRAGSTQQHRLIYAALEKLDIPYRDKGYIKLGRWNARNSETDNWFADFRKDQEGWKHSETILVKAHLFIPEMFSWCHQTIVYTTYPSCIENPSSLCIRTRCRRADVAQGNVGWALREHH